MRINTGLKQEKKVFNNYVKLLFIVFFISCSNANSQSVEVIRKGETTNLAEGKKFAFLEQATDTNKVTFVATIIARDKNKKSNIEKLYFDIRGKANKLGANCYKVNSFTRGGKRNEAILILDCYVASDSMIEQNYVNHEKNVVYVFGGEREEDESTFSFSVNDTAKEIKSGAYYKYYLKDGQKIKISKGGKLGESFVVWGEKDKQPTFITVSGFGLDPLVPSSDFISMHVARVERINNLGLGFLLVQLLKQSNN